MDRGVQLRRSLTISSFKGGAGKSTTTAAIAAQLAGDDRKVLVVDMDPQGGVTAALGGSTSGSGSTWDLLGRLRFKDCLITRHGIDLVPADVRLAGAELSTTNGWQHRLKERIEGAMLSYDWVLVDSAPGLGVLPFMALTATRQSLIVCPPDFMSVRVLPHVLETCGRAGSDTIGIVPTMVSGRPTKHEREALGALEQIAAGRHFPAIPRRVALQDAALAGVPIQIHSPRSDAVAAYRELTERIATHGN